MIDAYLKIKNNDVIFTKQHMPQKKIKFSNQTIQKQQLKQMKQNLVHGHFFNNSELKPGRFILQY